MPLTLTNTHTAPPLVSQCELHPRARSTFDIRHSFTSRSLMSLPFPTTPTQRHKSFFLGPSLGRHDLASVHSSGFRTCGSVFGPGACIYSSCVPLARHFPFIFSLCIPFIHRHILYSSFTRSARNPRFSLFVVYRCLICI